MQFPGTASLVDAFAGGSGYEQTAYNRETARLTAAKTAAAAMDKKVAEAAMAKTENAQFQDLSKYISEPRDLALVQSGTAGEFSSLQTGLGTEQKNQLRTSLKPMIEKAIKSGKPPMDVFNMIISGISGTTMTAPEIGAEAQSGANIAKTQADTKSPELISQELAKVLAQTQQAQSAVGANNALTLKRNRDQPTGAAPNMEALGTLEQEMLYTNPDTVPVTTDKNIFSPDVIENLPFTDPRAKKAWASMTKDQKSALMRDFAPEFMTWRMNKQATDPRVNDAQMAVALFMEEKGLAGVLAPADTTTGEQAATAKPTREVIYQIDPGTGKLVPVAGGL